MVAITSLWHRMPVHAPDPLQRRLDGREQDQLVCGAHAGSGSEPAPVTLPHDAMIGTERSPAGHAATAYFRAELGVQKSFEPGPDEEGGALFLEFEGVYRDGGCGQRHLVATGPVAIRASPSRSTICCVSVSPMRSRSRPGPRRQPVVLGCGHLPQVWLLQGDGVHLVRGGLQLETPEIDDVRGRRGRRRPRCATSPSACRVPSCDWRCWDADGMVVAAAEAPVTTAPGDVLMARATAERPEAPPLGPGRSLPLLLPGHPAGRRRGARRGVGDLRHSFPHGRSAARSAHQRKSRLLRVPVVHHDKRPARAATDQSCRGTPGRAPQRGRLNAIRSAHIP